MWQQLFAFHMSSVKSVQQCCLLEAQCAGGGEAEERNCVRFRALAGWKLCATNTHFMRLQVGVLCWMALPSSCHHLEAQPELTATALGWDGWEWIVSHWHSAKHLVLGLKDTLSIVLSRDGPGQELNPLLCLCRGFAETHTSSLTDQAEASPQVQFLLNDSNPALQKWQMSPEELLY